MFGDLVEFVCVRAEHLPAPVPTGREITMFDRCWAYCRGGADGDHEWQRVPAADGAAARSPEPGGPAAVQMNIAVGP